MKLGAIIKVLEAQDPEKVCPIGFKSAFTRDRMAAFEPAENVTVKEMLEEARSAIGLPNKRNGELSTIDLQDDCVLGFKNSRHENLGPIVLGYMLGETI
jgi:hypothetical protein